MDAKKIDVSNYLERIVLNDVEENVHDREICTRFPPEPNGYLHIGSAYAININHTIAKKFAGRFNLRFDDTNPAKEEIEYVESIIEDMKWLGFDFGQNIFYGSDYFIETYESAKDLIKKGLAYVCDLNQDQIKTYRGSPKSYGKNSPFRERSVVENLELFEKMKNGDFAEGECVLRAKIDMKSSNLNMRDPVIYRIIKTPHYRTGSTWCIYPMYDFAHPIQDSLENITHSLCSIEFKNHRPLYDWVIKNLEVKLPPKQKEFGRMNLSGVVTSKRYLRQLVNQELVEGWDDPRLPTLRGMRRRGYTPQAIRKLLSEIGVSKDQSLIDISVLENLQRKDLALKVPQYMAVLDPIKVIITNYPKDKVEYLKVANNKKNPEMGYRKVIFSRVLYIEKSDFAENYNEEFRRLTLHQEVRLMSAYFIKCHGIVKNDNGEITEIHCTYDPETKSGTGFDGRKVRGTMQWVSEKRAIEGNIRLYSNLFNGDFDIENVEDIESSINMDSKITISSCLFESILGAVKPEDRFQLVRHGYFVVDRFMNKSSKLVVNRIVPLKSTK